MVTEEEEEEEEAVLGPSRASWEPGNHVPGEAFPVHDFGRGSLGLP